ncbi:MAG: LPP20 family lipoprotein [Paludibacter sp.]|nr:LPP20 family lipoprotein [Paludibacter sp.]
MSKLILTILFAFNLLCIGGTKKVVPEWISTHPSDNEYYYGVGHAYIDKKVKKHVEEARKDALSNLAGEISIQIFSSNELITLVRNDKISEEFTTLIQSRVKTDLEGYEMAAEYQTKKEYWVLYRLSKQLYREMELRKMSNAVQNAKSCYFAALEAKQHSDYKNAIIQYTKALDHVKKYLNEYIEVDANGAKENLIVQSFSGISAIISGIKLIPVSTDIKTKQATEIKAEQLAFTLVDEENKAISGFPVTGYYSERSISDYSKHTDEKGTVRFSIPKVRSQKATEYFKVTPDINTILAESASDYLIRKVILENKAKSSEVSISVAKPSFQFTVINHLDGNIFSDDQINSTLGSLFLKEGYNLTDQSDFNGNIQTQITFRGNNNGIFQVQLSGTFEFRDRSGKIVYSSVIPPINGVQLTKEKAAQDALKNFSAQIESKYFRELKEAIMK